MFNRQFFVIANPASGSKKGSLLLKEVVIQLQKAGFKVQSFLTNQPGHASKLVGTLPLDKGFGIVIIGGDGTIHEVINGMLHRKDGLQLPIGIIPSGTGNSLARDLNLISWKEALKVIIEGYVRTIDVAKITCTDAVIYSCNVIGWGLPAVVNTNAESLRFFGEQRYNIASLLEIAKNRVQPIKIIVGNTKTSGNYSFIVASNTKYSGNGMRMAPDAELSDGLIDLLIIKEIPRIELIRLFLKVFKGTHLPNHYVQYLQVPSFKLESDIAQPLIVDGQIIGSTPCSIKIIPNYLAVFSNKLNARMQQDNN